MVSLASKQSRSNSNNNKHNNDNDNDNDNNDNDNSLFPYIVITGEYEHIRKQCFLSSLCGKILLPLALGTPTAKPRPDWTLCKAWNHREFWT